jgi:hypothetical protein
MQIDFENLTPSLKTYDILNQVSERDIYKAWCSKFPSASFRSPFRKDPTPSFGFYQKGDRWLWKDLGGNGDNGDVFDFVAKCEGTDLPNTIKKIAERFNIVLTDTAFTSSFAPINQDKYKGEKERSLIQVVRRPITNPEYAWWNKILITPGIMEMYLMRAAQEVWLRKPEWTEKKLIWQNEEGNPIYYFLSPYSNNIKGYRPEEPNKNYKHIGNMDPRTDIMGYKQCMIKEWPGRPLLLVKSLKEVAFMRAFGINAMANTGEHVHFEPDFIRHIKKYCFPILYLGDNDWPGMRATLRHERRNAIPGIIIPKSWGAKDPTDLWLANYRKVYDLLNLIHAYFQRIRASTFNIDSSRGLRHSREAA